MNESKIVDLFEALKKSLEGSGPRVGRLVHCDQCGKQKKPIGRDAAPGADFCDHECPVGVES